jgi:hypothetical protein
LLEDRMTKAVKQEEWEGSLLDWIDFAYTEYFEPDALREYQRWLTDQLAKPGNVVPFRLVSGRAPKGTEFVRRDGTVLYAADNEPLAGLWGLVAQRRGTPGADLKELLSRRLIPGSWPPNRKPTRFSCRWGPAPLQLKGWGMKIAHLLDSGRNSIPVEPEQLARRALLTLSLVNCFPMPNRSWVEFSRNGVVTSDLAELPEVQSLLLSYIAEHIGGAVHLGPLFAAFGPGCRVALDVDWRRKAAAYRFAVRPKTAKPEDSRRPKPRVGAKRAAMDGPRAFVPSRDILPDLHAVIAELRLWLSTHPGVERLDDRAGGSNGTAYVRFEVRHLADTDLVIARPHFPGSVWRASDYTRVFHLNGDTKVSAIRRLMEMEENGLKLDEIIEPAVTELRTWGGRLTGENPCFVLVGTDGAKGLYCYTKRGVRS